MCKNTSLEGSYKILQKKKKYDNQWRYGTFKALNFIVKTLETLRESKKIFSIKNSWRNV